MSREAGCRERRAVLLAPRCAFLLRSRPRVDILSTRSPCMASPAPRQWRKIPRFSFGFYLGKNEESVDSEVALDIDA